MDKSKPFDRDMLTMSSVEYLEFWKKKKLNPVVVA